MSPTQGKGCLPASLIAALGENRASDPAVLDVFGRFLESPGYSRGRFRALTAIGRGENGYAWEVRAMAALMLEEMLAGLTSFGQAEVQSVLAALGLKATEEKVMPEWLATEGFTSRDPSEFFVELNRKMSRIP